MALVRNKSCVPRLETEGVFVKPIPVHKSKSGRWDKGLKPYERMFSHHTLASARRFAHFKPFSGLIPQDDLDFILESPYDHSTEIFPDKIDTCLQADTVGLKNCWRRLRNTRPQTSVPDPHANPAVDVIGGFAEISGEIVDGKPTLPYRYNPYHPVLISGITEKRHPSNVKLMLSSHHSPQTNAGYSRQDSDGTVFQY